MLKLFKEEKGAAVLMTALAITVLLGLAAIIIDLGVLYLNKSELANMTDAAALAGARDLPDDSAAVIAARDYAARNGKTGDSVQVAISDDKYTIAVSATRTVPLFFAKVFDFNSSTVVALSKATSAVISGLDGVVPFCVEQQELVYGQIYRLKQGGGSGYDGNYGGLALGGSGAEIYVKNLKYGYDGKLTVGQWVDTEPGTMSGPTTDGVTYRIDLDPVATYDTVKPGSPRIIIVPVIESLEVNGRSAVHIVGFAGFFLEGVGGSGNNNYVDGRFIKVYTVGDTSGAPRDFGLRNISLVR